MKYVFRLVIAAVLIASCGESVRAAAVRRPAHFLSPIQHVVIIVQENRSFDNLFNGFPGADTAQSGMTSGGQTVALQPISFKTVPDIDHSHLNWYREYANGNLYFDLGSPKNAPPTYPYAYVTQSETKPYWQLAQFFTLADRMFQSNTGPSFPAHQYLISGASQIGPTSYPDENPAMDNQGIPVKRGWGCDDPASTLVALVGPNGTDLPKSSSVFPCFDYPTLADELDQNSLSWRYYAPAAGSGGYAWSGYDAVRHIREGNDWSQNVVSPETSILSAKGHLANVTWVTPSGVNSDHAGSDSTSGPQWVASVVNAIGNGPDWNSTAILITWDDWGGWYDHVVPPQLDAMGLGFRVPLLVVSPYANHGYVSHVQHEFGSILHFTEENFGLAPLSQSDRRADDLSDCFNFFQHPARYVTIPTTRSPQSFMRERNVGSPDND